jgi:hypothetical protein
MSIKEVAQIAHQIEKEPHGADSHARNLEHAYNQIEDLQKKESFCRWTKLLGGAITERMGQPDTR